MRSLLSLSAIWALIDLPGSYAQQPVPGSYTLRTPQLDTQPPRIFFEHLTWREGLPPGGVSHVFTDRQGYLWLMRGYAGLSRYDGHEFTHFVPDASDSAALPADMFGVPPVYDASGRLWFAGTFGIAGYDPQQGSFRRVPFNRTIPPNNQSPMVLCADPAGRHWVLANGNNIHHQSLYRFDPEAGTFHLYDLSTRQAQAAYGPAGVFTMQNHALGLMETGPRGRLWFYYDDSTHIGLMQFEPEEDRWTLFPVPKPLYPGTTRATSWLRILPSPDDERVWMSGWNQGLWSLEFRAMRWVQLAPWRTFVDICPRSPDELWLTSYDEGLFVLNTRTRLLQQYRHQPGRAAHESPLEGRLLGLSRDNPDNILWIASEKGLSKIDPHMQNFTRPSPLPPEGVCEMLSPDSASQAVFAIHSVEGATVLHKWQEPQNVIRSRAYAPWPTALWEEPPYFIQRGPQGRYWAGIGLELDPQTLALHPVPYPVSRVRPEQLSRAWPGVAAPDGDIWFPNRWGGLFRFDAAKEQLQGIDPFQVPDSIQLVSVRTVLPASAGRLWLATDAGLALYDPRTRACMIYTEIEHDTASLPGRAAMDIRFDPAGRLWICAARGLCWLDTARMQIHRIPETAYAFSRMMLDRRGTIWAVATEGLLRCQPTTGRVRLYTEQDGLRMQQFERLALSPGGSVMLGNKHIWDPAGFVDNTRRPEVVFTDFKVFDKPYPLPRQIAFMDEIVLRHTDNFFTLTFSAMSFTQPELNRYRWQLEGIDPAWVEGGNRHSVSYTNLPPGSYTFRVMAANNDGYWSERPRTLRIRILPAWWQTWQFKALMLLAAGLAAFWLYRSQIARIRARAATEKKEAELAQEKSELLLRLAEAETSMLRAQMNPHFLFNVLVSIDRFLLENAPQSASEYLNKFSRLIRLVLEHSGQDRVALGSELEALRLYLELETLRFKEKIRWVLDIDPEIDLEFTLVPPMLLQPFVENAIWHGLLHKETGGTVRIVLRLLPGSELLRVQIEDDGIGRAQAEALKSRSASRRKSFGTQLTQERLAILAKMYSTEQSRIEIEDLVDESAAGCGTRVIIEFSV
ncbi:MAG: histidine kinase [Bacteroidia bacterium]|nr:histidine kinase [Bacteroidia bacterium]